MARETKVGLLAGLAFIICFAVILANRGRPVSTAMSPPYLVDGGSRARQVAETVGSQTTSPRSAEPGPEHQGQPYNRTGAAPSDHYANGTSYDHHARNGAAVILPAHADRGQSTPATRYADSGSTRDTSMNQDDLNRDPSALASLTRRTNGPPLISPSGERAEHRRLLQQHLDAASGRERNTNRRELGANSTRPYEAQYSNPAPAATSPLTPTSAAARRHTVVPGDTLTRIATAYYGTSSAAVIKALFEANSSVIPSPDALVVGDELTIPVIEGHVPQSAPRSSQAAHTPVRADAPAPAETRSPITNAASDKGRAPFSWYQIKKGDRYMSIAREQLGNMNRWREIYELNLDKFPDAGRIREGVRIKLPLTAVSPVSGERP